MDYHVIGISGSHSALSGLALTCPDGKKEKNNVLPLGQYPGRRKQALHAALPFVQKFPAERRESLLPPLSRETGSNDAYFWLPSLP